MQHVMQDTSLTAYYGEVLDSLADKHRQVLRVFAENPAMDFTNAELSRELEWPINTVTPRVYELRGEDRHVPIDHDNPLIVKTQRRQCTVTGRSALAWGLNPEYNRGKYKLWKSLSRRNSA